MRITFFQAFPPLIMAGTFFVSAATAEPKTIGSRAQWLISPGKLYSYHVSFDYLHQKRCQTAVTADPAYSVKGVTSHLENRFPTDTGKANFLAAANLILTSPDMSEANKYNLYMVEQAIKSDMDRGMPLDRPCKKVVGGYKKLVDQSLPETLMAMDAMLAEYPDGMAVTAK